MVRDAHRYKEVCMNAIIMAGGEGTRLKSVTGDLPKPMVPLAGRPLLEHILALLKKNGVERVCLSLCYRPEAIMEHFGDGAAFGMHIEYNVQTSPLGTAGGVKACRDFTGGRDFLVISGDSACDFDLKALMEAHRRHRPAVTMALYAHETPLAYGTVLTDTAGRVVSFLEKPAWARVVSDLVNTGLYVVSPEAMELVPEDTVFDFARDLFPLLLRRGMAIRALPMEGYWCDVGTPRAYHRCNLDALDGQLHLELPVPDEPAKRTPPSPPAGALRELPCRSRARVMRYVSQTLMEAGADFSDGIRLDTGKGRVHIAPAPDRESILIDADADSPEGAKALAAQYEALVRDAGAAFEG